MVTTVVQINHKYRVTTVIFGTACYDLLKSRRMGWCWKKVVENNYILEHGPVFKQIYVNYNCIESGTPPTPVSPDAITIAMVEVDCRQTK